jgi:tRNA pseudouridine13 synthase
VQKRGSNTDWVAAQLARAAGCNFRDVGYAGLKDRHAVTTQWFSIPVAKGIRCQWKDWNVPDVRIMQAVRHQKKLKRGALNGNRFDIVVRELEGDLDDLAARLQEIKRRGLPNYFGRQRFGHAGSNVTKGVHWLFEGGRLPRAKRSIYLSAVRSFMFNHVLARRLEQGNWDRLLDGEVVMLDGTKSVFLCNGQDHELSQRCMEGDIHPTGPLPGRAGFAPKGDAAEVESAVLLPYRNLVEALGKARVDSKRRSLRLFVSGLEWELSKECLRLSFILPPGAYATSVIDELVSLPA